MILKDFLKEVEEVVEDFPFLLEEEVENVILSLTSTKKNCNR